jgi:hypothetical protein
LRKPALIVEAVRFAREDRAQIEPKAVYMRFVDPITQAVGDHLDDIGVRNIQRVAGARVVDVEARIVRQETVIRGVVDAFEGQGRSALVALGGMVVDDVENDFQSRIVEARDHLLEFAQALLRLGCVARIGGKKTDAVIAPVIGQAFLQQVVVVDEDVNGQ